MALKLDNALLDELGLGALPEGEKQLLLRQIYEKLEMNVGMRLADQMTNEQLDEFEKFVDANDDKGAFQWLESNFPNYKDVVNDEFEKLKTEIKQYAPQMLAVAAQNAQQPPAGVQSQPPMPGPETQQFQPQPYPAPTQGPQPGYQQQTPSYPTPQPSQPPAGTPLDQPGSYQNPSSSQPYSPQPYQPSTNPASDPSQQTPPSQ